VNWIHLTLFPADGVCYLGHVSACMCHLQVLLLVTIIPSCTQSKFSISRVDPPVRYTLYILYTVLYIGLYILSRDSDGVWIGNQIYWTLTLVTTNNDSLTELHAPKDCCIYSTPEVFSVFTSRCLVVASTADVPLPLGYRTVLRLT
jgi:hypothetical protein